MTRKLPWLLICAVSVFALAFVYRRGVDLNYDLRNYHYFVGYSLIHWRFDKDIAPAGIQSFFNPLPCAVFYLLISSLRFPTYAFVIAALQLSSLPILVFIIEQIDGELENRTPSVGALVALCLCLAAPSVVDRVGDYVLLLHYFTPGVTWSSFQSEGGRQSLESTAGR